jgi:hypothetical protein
MIAEAAPRKPANRGELLGVIEQLKRIHSIPIALAHAA